MKRFGGEKPGDKPSEKPSAGRASGMRGAASSIHAHDAIEFLRFALHDLQNPVAVLTMCVELLERDLSRADEQSRATLEDAKRAARRIQQYVDHLVTAEKLSSRTGRRFRTRVRMDDLLKDLCEEYGRDAKAAGVSLELNVDRSSGLSLRADRVLLERIFQNLLENALRHVSQGGRILVEARGGSVAEVRVCNDGTPVRIAERERIFDRYFADPTEPGAGSVGLYFCKRVAEAHGGTVRIEDYSDWPTCFVVRLPSGSI